MKNELAFMEFHRIYREKLDSYEVVDTHSLKTQNILEKNTEACKL